MLSIFESHYIDLFAERNAPFNSVEFNDFCLHFQRCLPLAEKHESPTVQKQAFAMSINSAFDVFNDCLENGTAYPNQHWPLKN